MFLIFACSCLCAIYWRQVLSGEWRCSWSSTDRRCSNYIWVINNSIAYYSASYIRDLTVSDFPRICASVNYVTIGSGNGLSPGRPQAITWNNSGLWSMGPLVRNFSKIWIKIEMDDLTPVWGTKITDQVVADRWHIIRKHDWRTLASFVIWQVSIAIDETSARTKFA